MSFHLFEHLEMTPPDPILGLNEQFKSDSNPKKVNLTIGIYLNAEGICPVLGSVKHAEKIMLERETTKNYLSIEGDARFGGLVREQVFELAARRLRDNQRFASWHTKVPSLLQGLVACAACGYSYYRTSTRTKNRKLYYYR